MSCTIVDVRPRGPGHGAGIAWLTPLALGWLEHLSRRDTGIVEKRRGVRILVPGIGPGRLRGIASMPVNTSRGQAPNHDQVRQCALKFIDTISAGIGEDDAACLFSAPGEGKSFAPRDSAIAQFLTDHESARVSLVSLNGMVLGLAHSDVDAIGVEPTIALYYVDAFGAIGFQGVWLFSEPVNLNDPRGATLADFFDVEALCRIAGHNAVSPSGEACEDSGLRYPIDDIVALIEARAASAMETADDVPGCIAELGNGGVSGLNKKVPRRLMRKKRPTEPRRRHWGRYQ